MREWALSADKGWGTLSLHVFITHLIGKKHRFFVFLNKCLLELAHHPFYWKGTPGFSKCLYECTSIRFCNGRDLRHDVTSALYLCLR